jgi:hypothetical protein
VAGAQGGKAEEVSWDDQQHICAFGRFNTRLHELRGELKAKAVRDSRRPLISLHTPRSLTNPLQYFTAV